MTEALDIHSASSDEVLASHRNVFEHWNRGRSLEEHMQYRLTSPSHSRATWYVGCVNGRVVVSLGSYPIQFRVNGRQMPGSAIGSVFTIPEFRRRGFAAKLVNWIDEHLKSAGVGMSVLYSDIDPDYYAKCGYLPCPSFEGWLRPKDQPARAAATPFAMVEFDVNDEFDEAATLYSEYHGAAAVSIVRDKIYWQSLIAKFPRDRYFWLQEPAGGRAGYARIQQVGTAGRITDFALANRDEELAEEFYAALVAAAANWEYETLGGWLPDNAATRKMFPLRPREKEITMIKPLAFEGELSAAAIASTSAFCEIDHV